MIEEQLIKVAKGLALIVPVIIFLRWFLGRQTGGPEEWAEYHINELKTRFDRGEIDEETYKRRVKELNDS